MTQQSQHRYLGLILGVYLLITLSYSAINPLFEGPDEHTHFFVAQYIADNNRLPSIPEDDALVDLFMSQEAAQPPLYYMIGSLLLKPFNPSEARAEIWYNEQVRMGDPSSLMNINHFVHTAREAWPWRGWVLGAHLLRGFSALLGLGTVWCVFASVRLLFSDPRLSLLATGLIAFLPQFNFLHSYINNDTLAIFFCSLATWRLLKFWQADQPWRLSPLLCLGVIVGLAALSKTVGALLAIFTMLVFGLRWLKSNRAQTGLFVRAVVVVSGIIFSLAGWLWWRNIMLYGEPAGVSQFVRFAGGDRAYTLLEVLAESSGLWWSLIGVFGWFNVLAPSWVFVFWTGLVLLALGLGIVGWKTADKSHTWLLLLPLLVYAGLVSFMLQTEAAQGRLLLPAIVVFALALATGLKKLVRVWWALVGIAFITSLTSLITIAAAYSVPPTIAAVPALATLINADLDEGIQLLAADVHTKVAQAGDPVLLTLYWQNSSNLSSDPDSVPEVVVELFGRELSLDGKTQSYQGAGQYPASEWPLNQIVVDEVGFELNDTFVAPVLADVLVRLTTMDVDEPSIKVGSVKLVPDSWPEARVPALAEIGQGIFLLDAVVDKTAVSANDTITVSVQWENNAVMDRSFTTLIHLGENGQPPLATGDGVAINGRYPTTVWGLGEVIDDQYTLQIPADVSGAHSLWLGMYDAETGARLPLTVDGVQQQNDVLEIGVLTIR